MKTLKFAALAILPALFVATPAQAGEVFGGLYVHDVDTFLTIAGVEDGMDVQLGWRGDRIGKTPLQPYAFAAVNTSGNTNYAAVGLSAKFGEQFFVRPGLGIAVHTGSTKGYQIDGNGKLEFGSRVLFEPELGIGAQITDRTSIEASWVHMSHATLFSKQNPGIDNLGVRLTFKL
ncbi:acyloxyacyl hydrolase [Sphingomonas daechungensis]|uniref:acyloxyacyl hydrolase n=1 Tax=Sphingomonas daechungensis TaxID=1176646 RepID=UPI003783CE25